MESKGQLLRRTLSRKMSSLLVRMSALFSGDPQQFLHGARGIVHVGANTGQERDLYGRLGLSVLWVEPLPDVYEKLAKNISELDHQVSARALLTDKVGETYAFNVAGNSGASSSILELKEHTELWPNIKYVETLELRSTTLDVLLEEPQFDLRNYDVLVLDVQGSELLVLQGAVKSLDGFDCVKVEVPDFESYAGCCQVGDIDSFMEAHGFVEQQRNKFATKIGVGSYFDVTYRRPEP